MNSELIKEALEKVPNPNILINTISCRVRQLSAGGGGYNRPLIEETASLGVADIALRELINDKITWEPIPQSRRRARLPNLGSGKRSIALFKPDRRTGPLANDGQ